MNSENTSTNKPALPLKTAAIFYVAMATVAAVLGWIFDINILQRAEQGGQNPLVSLVAGVSFGLMIVVISHALERYFEWARRLNVDFASMLGKITWARAFGLAALSGVGEELLFRGFFQQGIEVWTGSVLASVTIAGLVFGAVHVGPDPRRFAAWTIMAVVLGWMIGVLYVWTGSVIAPIAAHFLINFLNLSTLIRRASEH
jgi:membrane protease YdiL (CAAX protease family)